MKRKPNGSFYIEIDNSGKKKSYIYSMDVVLNADEFRSALPIDNVQPENKIKISKNAYNLAVLRMFPQKENEIEEIIKYSKGGRVKMSFFEKILIWCKQ